LSLNIGVLLKEWGLGMTGLVLENGKEKKAGEARFFSLPPTNNALCHSECNEESQYLLVSN
jgi:hypothetical protein